MCLFILEGDKVMKNGGMNIMLRLRKAARSGVQIFYWKQQQQQKKGAKLFLKNHVCVCHKVGMLWGNKYYMPLKQVCEVTCQHWHLLEVSHKADRGFDFDNRTNM